MTGMELAKGAREVGVEEEVGEGRTDESKKPL